MRMTALKQLLCIAVLALLWALPAGYAQAASARALPDLSNVREGDIVFQPSNISSQSLAIKLATNSQYSHCGIVLKQDGELHVYEALGKMTMTPLVEWVRRGVDSHYVLMRLKDGNALTPQVIDRMKAEGKKFANLEYDRFFEWDDKRQYCSELVWKIYARGAGIELCPLRRVGDYALDHDEVVKKLKERYKDKIPYDQEVVAPVDIMNSPLLEVVQSN